jgi:hypothetical protein
LSMTRQKTSHSGAVGVAVEGSEEDIAAIIRSHAAGRRRAGRRAAEGMPGAAQ